MGLLSKWFVSAPAPAAAPKKEPKPAPKKRAPRRDFNELYPADALIELLVADNPKRRGTKAQSLYDSYEFCNTISDCLEVGMTYRMIDGDVKRGYIDVVLK